MKIAVTAKGPEKKDPVDPRFGRAAFFVIFDTESEEFEAIDNAKGVQAGGGAGVSSGEILSQKEAEVLLTGHCGPKAFQTLKAAGITIHTGAKGTVEEALERYKKGDWEPTDNPDVQSRW